MNEALDLINLIRSGLWLILDHFGPEVNYLITTIFAHERKPLFICPKKQINKMELF